MIVILNVHSICLSVFEGKKTLVILVLLDLPYIEWVNFRKCPIDRQVRRITDLQIVKFVYNKKLCCVCFFFFFMAIKRMGYVDYVFCLYSICVLRWWGDADLFCITGLYSFPQRAGSAWVWVTAASPGSPSGPVAVWHSRCWATQASCPQTSWRLPDMATRSQGTAGLAGGCGFSFVIDSP